MDRTKQQTFSSVLSINPYNQSYYKGVSNRLAPDESPAYAKDQYAISFLNTKSFITAMVEISKNIPEDDVYDALENKVYEELALDKAETKAENDALGYADSKVTDMREAG